MSILEHREIHLPGAPGLDFETWESTNANQLGGTEGAEALRPLKKPSDKMDGLYRLRKNSE
jgi:hypothetical protein